MNWGRAKTILIFLFLIINLFLYSMLSRIDSGINTIDDSVMENAVKVAQNRGITISKEVIDNRRFKNGSMELFGLAAEPDRCAERFLGRNSKCTVSDYVLQSFKYEKNEKVLEINQSILHYVENRDAKEIKNEKEAAENAARNLEKFGIKRNNIKIIKNGTENGRNYIEVKPRYKNIDLEGLQLTVFYDGGGITELSGTWFDFADFTESENFLEDITSVITVLNREVNDAEIEILEAGFAYYISENQLGGRFVTAIPAYTFKCSDGSTVIIDARTGKNVNN